MRTLDFSPFSRFSVGFDRLQDQLDSMSRNQGQAQTYPPYNIEVTGDDSYRITMAVAGFSEDELDITIDKGSLIVTGNPAARDEQVHYLHHGIAGRGFERRFELADFIKVAGATLANGMLDIALVREVPDEMKPRTIKIAAPAAAKRLADKAA